MNPIDWNDSACTVCQNVNTCFNRNEELYLKIQERKLAKNNEYLEREAEQNAADCLMGFEEVESN